jgi:hypothetical protein
LVVAEDLILEHLQVDDYFGTRLTKLQRIGEKVNYDLHQSALVSINLLIERGFLRRDLLDQQLDTLLQCNMGNNTECLADKFWERKVFLV